MGVKYVPIWLYIKLTEPVLIALLSSLLKKVDHVVKFTRIEGMGMTRDTGLFANAVFISFLFLS